MRGRVTEYSNISSTSGPTAIVQGPDHYMWFVETTANKLGRVDLSGTRS
jgi:streptogramin lyase